MGIGAAVGASAVAGLAGSALSAGAAKSAAGQQAAAAQQAAAQAAAQYQQTRGDLMPYNVAGQQAAQYLNGIAFNLPSLVHAFAPGGLTFQPTQAQLEATPGYQWTLGQGLQSVANSNAAQGRGISGAALKGAANYATGLANNTLALNQQIFQQNLANQLSPLYGQLSAYQDIANRGENAAAQTGQQGVQATQNANNALMSGASASAAGTVGQANALSSGLSTLGSLPTNYLLYNQLFNGGGGLLGGGGGAVGGGFSL